MVVGTAPFNQKLSARQVNATRLSTVHTCAGCPNKCVLYRVNRCKLLLQLVNLRDVVPGNVAVTYKTVTPRTRPCYYLNTSIVLPSHLKMTARGLPSTTRVCCTTVLPWVGASVVGTFGPSRMGFPMSTRTCPSSNSSDWIRPVPEENDAVSVSMNLEQTTALLLDKSVGPGD